LHYECFRCYKTEMSGSNVYDFESRPQIEALEQQLGRAECVRLGFLFEDDEGVVRLTVAGFGYLLYVGSLDIKGVAEAFAAGYQCAREEMA
jgi:hypothetical protein